MSRGASPGAAPAGPPPSLHARSFKLRFASQREPGRSYVSLTKPLGLPATVTGKFYTRSPPAAGDEEGALRRIRRMFECGPRSRLAAPATSAQECGWHAEGAAAAQARADPRTAHPLRDSAWLRERLRVLAADERLRQR